MTKEEFKEKILTGMTMCAEAVAEAKASGLDIENDYELMLWYAFEVARLDKTVEGSE